jgi:hypothetical protein
MVPAELDWFAWLTLPIHEHSRSRTLGWHGSKGWLYDGHLVGRDRKQASEMLRRRQGRATFLPEYQTMCERAEQLILGDGDLGKAIAHLAQIQRKATLELTAASHAERMVLRLERAAAKCVEAAYQEQLRRDMIRRRISGLNDDDTDEQTRILPHPQGPKGGDNHHALTH